MSDQILDRYLEEYATAVATKRDSRTKTQAKIMRSLVRYLRKKSGGLAAHAEILSPLILDLESQLCVCDLTDFLFVSETIVLAKKFTLVVKKEYAGGLKRAPTREEREKSQTLLQSVDNFRPENTDSPANGYSFD
jgi:hypothetical protein